MITLLALTKKNRQVFTCLFFHVTCELNLFLRLLHNTKYLGRGAFTQLISRGFIGTASTRSQAFKKAMAKLGSDRELIIAIKTEWQNDTEDERAQTASDASSPALPF